jgi:hypothetical protein
MLPPVDPQLLEWTTNTSRYYVVTPFLVSMNRDRNDEVNSTQWQEQYCVILLLL